MFRVYNYSFFRPNTPYLTPNRQSNWHKNNQQFRTIVNLVDLNNTYNVLHEKQKHLSPIYGAIFSRAIERFYEVALKRNQARHTATERLVLALFNKVGTEFRTTQKKNAPAYSLTPVLLAKLIAQVDAFVLDDKQLFDHLIVEWKATHKAMTGCKLLVGQSAQVLKDVIDSKNECRLKLYPTQYTESILLTFLFLKCKKREDLKDYILTLSKDDHKSNVLSIEKENNYQIPIAQKLFERIIGYNKNKEFQKFRGLSRMLNQRYEENVLTLLQANYLHKVALSNYRFKNSPYVTNCVEVCFHNFCNIILHNNKTGLFDLNLLSGLKINDKLLTLYQMQNFRTDMINAPEVGQALMDLLSGNEKFIYVNKSANKSYELETAVENFLLVINFLFGLNASSISEFSDLFSDKKRAFSFVREDNSIQIDMELLDQNKSYSMIFHFSNLHCSFTSNYLLNDNASNKGLDTLTRYAEYAFERDPSWMCILRDIYSKSFENITAKKEMSIDDINNILFYLGPLEVYWLARKIFRHINEGPHWKNLLNRIIEADDSIFYYAAYKNNVSLLKYLIAQGHDVNRRSSEHRNRAALHATYHLDTIQLLLKSNANVNIVDAEGKSPLHYAAHACGGDIEVVKILLASGADPNLMDKQGLTPLFKAAPRMVSLLLEANANPNIKNLKNETPIFVAENIETVKLLIEAGADLTVRDITGKTPLDVIKKHYSHGESQLILEAIRVANMKERHERSVFNRWGM